MKRLAIIGSTGSIGRQALAVVDRFPREFTIVSLVCGHDSEKFKQQVKKYRPKAAVAAETDGGAAVIRAATLPEADLVVMAVTGLAGLRPTLAAIQANKNVALATKEVLVGAGELVMKAVVKNKVKLIPIDSEMAALQQGLAGSGKKEIRRLLLTLGKGNLALMTKKELTQVTPAQVVKRNHWNMGKTITIDSATGINKAMEVIEASWLFGISGKQIEIVVHPEYICHSLVEFIDGSFTAELGLADMRRYIQQALFYPGKKSVLPEQRLELIGKRLGFEPAPIDKFPALTLGHEVLKSGGSMGAFFLGVNEAVVARFLNGQSSFNQIPILIKKAMNHYRVVNHPNLEQIFQAYEEGRKSL